MARTPSTPSRPRARAWTSNACSGCARGARPRRCAAWSMCSRPAASRSCCWISARRRPPRTCRARRGHGCARRRPPRRPRWCCSPVAASRAPSPISRSSSTPRARASRAAPTGWRASRRACGSCAAAPGLRARTSPCAGALRRNMAGRIACLLVPALPLAAELRAHPELAGRPFAIASGPGPRAEIVAVSPEAASAGVRALSTVVHARAACAALELRVLSPALEGAARAALLDAALSTSPRAEPAPPGAGAYAAEAAVFVDARGVSALFRSEAGFAGALAERARRLGLPACVALASSRGVARIAARLAARESRAPGDGVTVIAPGGDTAFLAPLPLDLLNPDDALAEALSRFGLRRVADLVRLPERALAARLGPGVLGLLALARGVDRAPPPPVPPDLRLEEATDLEAPIERLEPLGFVLRGLVSRLAERLACRGLAFGDLELALGLEGGGRDARRVGVAAPTLDERVVLRLLLLALEAAPPGAALERIALASVGRALRGDQLDFFRPAGPAPAALARTLAELAALA